MTYKEIIDDAKGDINAYGQFAGLGNSNLVRFVSEALNEIQNKTHVIKSTITVLTSALDSNGAVALPVAVTVPLRCVYTRTGGTLIGSPEVLAISPDDMAKMKQSENGWMPVPGNKLYLAVEANKLYFWPFQSLSGTFTLTVYPKIPIFAASRSTDANSMWYGWDTPANIATKMSTVLLPQEMEVAEAAITAYVAAQLLQTLPGWKKLFKQDYDERMQKFYACFDTIKQDQPTYPVNHKPTPDYGW